MKRVLSSPARAVNIHTSGTCGWLIAFLLLGLGAGCTRERPPLQILVMDPLAAPFACACSPADAWHDYEPLAEALRTSTKRDVRIDYQGDLSATTTTPVLIIGKVSDVCAQAAAHQRRYGLIAQLTDRCGATTQRGLIVARTRPQIEDAEAPRRIGIGPARMVEKHDAALVALQQMGIATNATRTIPTCPLAVIAVYEGDVDVAAISGYAEYATTCGSFAPTGTVTVIGRTDPVPFIGVFVTETLNPHSRRVLTKALFRAGAAPAVRTGLKSAEGFVAPVHARH